MSNKLARAAAQEAENQNRTAEKESKKVVTIIMVLSIIAILATGLMPMTI